MSQVKNGVVKEVKKKEGRPNPYAYIIEVQDEENNTTTYLAHVGDIKENEDSLYELQNKGKLIVLKEGDQVEFEIGPSEPKAMHVHKK